MPPESPDSSPSSLSAAPLPIWLRPERAATGRPAERSRAEITAAAIALADEEGLEAVTMRRVAARLGTGAASLYRYVANRDDLLDLMTDEVAAEYDLPAEPSGDPVADLVGIALQARELMLRHRWLGPLVVARPVLGPNAAALMERALGYLSGRAGPDGAKLEAFALVQANTALLVQTELGLAGRLDPRYLATLAASPDHPHLAAALAAAAPRPPADLHFQTVMTRLIRGLLS
ncbi:TetR/AcrR family transcriptional regulator [Phaeacidiphilus oryzae]|uniref:TetR/AcrR family transcriptional regulator n=1 Tax=Phaeacidiphilus oryzae TaxID=348818 RepID=UPI00068D45CB|nr:TetR/AcrR family transcriptional regulator [Phaeacidiphilus oryzae]